MRTRVLQVSTAALAVALVSAAGAGARAEATQIKLATTLNASQETPATTGDVSAARGTFAATVTRTAEGATVAWTLTFSGLTGPAAAAHIHTGARGVAGPVSVALCGPCESGVAGTATVTDAAVLAAIQNGGAYVNVHTATNKAGEIRGQLGVVAPVRAALGPGAEVPKPAGKLKRAKGTFTGTATRSGSTGVLTWRLTFSGLTGKAVAAHIHAGARGKAGPVAAALCGPCKSGARGRATLSAALIKALENGRAYVTVHTVRNPGGEIRGQVPRLPLTLT